MGMGVAVCVCVWALTEQVRVGAGQQLVQHVEVALALRHAAHALLRHTRVLCYHTHDIYTLQILLI